MLKLAAEPKRWMRVTAPVAASLRLRPAKPDQMRRDHPVDDLQYRREHVGVHREEAT